MTYFRRPRNYRHDPKTEDWSSMHDFMHDMAVRMISNRARLLIVSDIPRHQKCYASRGHSDYDARGSRSRIALLLDRSGSTICVDPCWFACATA